MLVFSVRQIVPERSMYRETMQDDDLRLCCMRASLFARKIESHLDFPHTGGACVSIIKIPDGTASAKHGQLLFHAVRHSTQTEITIAPAWLQRSLPVKATSDHPLNIDLRYTSDEVLPEEVRAIVPGKRMPTTR